MNRAILPLLALAAAALQGCVPVVIGAGGAAAYSSLEDRRTTGTQIDDESIEVRASNRPEFGRMGERLGEAVAALAEASRWMGSALRSNPDAALAGASPYLRLFGLAAGGVYLAKGALAAARQGGADGRGDAAAQAIAVARFFAETLATAAPGLKETVVAGADATLALSPAALSA